MALEMKVYKNVDHFEPKIFFGMTWRQLLLTIPFGIVVVAWSVVGAATDPENIDWVAGWAPGIRKIPPSLAQFPLSE